MSGWRLLVWNAPPNDPALYRMGFRPLRKNPRLHVGFYGRTGKQQLLRHIGILKAAGLHGRAIPFSKNPKPNRPDRDPKTRRQSRAEAAPFNRSLAELRAFAKAHRRNPTDAELVLWRHVSGKRLGVRVRRQFVVSGFIADFFIVPWRLVIEVDGAFHDQRSAYDQRRDAFIRGAGFTILRFSNDAVLSDPQAVIATIVSHGRSLPLPLGPPLGPADQAGP